MVSWSSRSVFFFFEMAIFLIFIVSIAGAGQVQQLFGLITDRVRGEFMRQQNENPGADAKNMQNAFSETGAQLLVAKSIQNNSTLQRNLQDVCGARNQKLNVTISGKQFAGNIHAAREFAHR